jgi:hypothetical protein
MGPTWKALAAVAEKRIAAEIFMVEIEIIIDGCVDSGVERKTTILRLLGACCSWLLNPIFLYEHRALDTFNVKKILCIFQT